ncbi:retrovirus-related pol polyprotein from transposon TNT 1-94 [Tanacetum coccineum]
MQHVNTEILKENQNLRKELKELTAITETWLNSSNKVNQCISEQIPTQKKRILGVDQLAEDPSSSGQKDLVFVKSSADDTKVSIPGVEIPWLSEGEVCSTPLPPLEKLDGAEPVSGPKTIKSILKSKSTFKAEVLKGIIVNEPSLAPAKGNKIASASKVNSAHTSKLKNCERTDHITCDHAEYMSSMNMSQHLMGQGGSSKRSRTPRPSKHFFLPCIHYGFNDHLSNDYVNYPICDIRRIHTTTNHNDIEWFKRGETLQAEKVEALESTKAESSNANRSKTPTKRLAHLNFKTINKLAKQNLVIGLPSLVYSKDKPCSSCEKGKHHRASFKTIQTSSIKKYLHLLHMDFFGPITPKSINHEKYTIVIVDEYSRYTWVYFLMKESLAPETIMSFIKRVKNQNDIKVKQLKTDNGTEFRNSIPVNFCDEKWISQNFSSPYTPKQNGVAERKNKTLIEAARTMLSGSVFSKQYWTEAVATACYTQNRSTIVKRHLKTPYEIFCKRISNIDFLYVFGCLVYIHNHKDHLRKFDEKADDGYFFGYSLVSKAFKVFNTRRQQTEETYHITFDESPDAIKFTKPSVDNIHIAEYKRYPPDEYLHPYEPSQRYQTKINDASFIEPYECPELVVLETKVPSDQMVSKALKHPGWVDAMQDELNQFARNKVWTLVPTPYGKTIIGSKWVFRNKRVETGIVIKNKERLVAQGYNQQEGIYYDETSALVARLEAIRIFLAFATYMNFTVYQMDVKSAFLNGKLKEEVFVKQPPGFESSEFPNHFCKLDKALYGLKQAPRACCARYQSNPKRPTLLLLREFLAMPSAEAEYVAVAGCCANILWIKSQITDNDIIYEKVPIFCDNTSAIVISNNLVLHSRTKHIDIRYHFIRDHILKGDIELYFIPTQYQLADIFTKPLDEPPFKRLIVKLGGIRGEIGITTFRNVVRAHYLPHSSKYVTPPSLAVVIPWFATIRFISIILEYMIPEYKNDELTLNLTQVFSVPNWDLKPNQPEGPPFIDHMLAICNAEVSGAFKAPKTSSQTEKKEKKRTRLRTTQHLLDNVLSSMETASQITRDAVTSHIKTSSQDLKTASECMTQPII